MSTPAVPPWVSVTQLRLDADDSELLERCAAAEKLPKVEILRRALRHFARQTLPSGPETAESQHQAESVA